MHGDDSRRGFGNNSYRRPQFQDRNQNYSPSTSYNYNPSGNGGNFNQQQRHHQQHPRRRTDRFRREVFGNSDRALKQNSQIIHLLQEISNKLSAIGGLAPTPAEVSRTNTQPPRGQPPVDMQDDVDDIDARGADDVEEMGDDEAVDQQEMEPDEGQQR